MRPSPEGYQYLLQQIISRWEYDAPILVPENFFRRMQVLDQLDIPLGFYSAIEPALHRRATHLYQRLEAANRKLFQTVRAEIQQGKPPSILLDYARRRKPSPGNAYDHLDDLLSGILQLEQPAPEQALQSSENVFYQPTPARHILALIRAANITATDVLIDLGSGLGHVPLLVSACTGARSIGVELQPGYTVCATRAAASLGLAAVTFVAQDARLAGLSEGTAFYLYTPFTGSILRTVLNSLREQAIGRPIRICTFGPCTLTLAEEPWLKAATEPAPGLLTVFHSQHLKNLQ